MGIEAIDKGSIHKITSGQVIVDLVSAVKELVENALDAGATSVEIRLKEYGSELIEVADNGGGIKPEDYEAFALKYHTSKISSFDEVSVVKTFGFRGEAISSLCAVSSVTVITRTHTQDVATKLDFDRNGSLAGKEVAARSPGTTVSLKELFKTLPVRYKAFQKNLKKEYMRLVHILQAYATVSTGVRLVATNQVKKAARTTVISTRHQPRMRDNFVSIFGAKAAMNLEDISASNTTFTISGLVSSAVKASGKTKGHPQFFFINKRPVELPKAVRIVNECYRSLSSPATAGCKAVCVINIETESGLVDVNVTPDKRSVIIQQEADLLKLLRASLEDIWDPAMVQAVHSISQKMSKHPDKMGPVNTKQQGILGHIEKSISRELIGAGESIETARPCPDASVLAKHTPAVDTDMVDIAGSVSPTGDGGQVVAKELSTTAVPLTAEQNNVSKGSTSVSPEMSLATRGLNGCMSVPHSRKRKHGALAAALARTHHGGHESHGRSGHSPIGSEGGLFIRSPGKPPQRLKPHLSVSGERPHQSDRVAHQRADIQDPVHEHWSTKQFSHNQCEGKQEVDDSKTVAPKLSGAVPQETTSSGLVSHISLLYSSPCAQPDDAQHGERRLDASFRDGGVSLRTSQIPTRADFLDDVDNVTGPVRQSESQSHESVMISSGPILSKHQMPVSVDVPHNGIMPAAPTGDDGGYNLNAPRFTLTASPTPGSQQMSQEIGDGTACELENADGAEELQIQLSPAALRKEYSDRQERTDSAGNDAFLVYVDMFGMRSRREAMRMQQKSSVKTGVPCGFRASSLQALVGDVNDQEEQMASGELEQRFNKKDFPSMVIHGQFNHGFIMASIGKELFIIDQHAADEKSTFERLQDSLELNKQPLIAPLELGLSSVDDLTIRENLDVFAQNGFGFIEDAEMGKMKLSSVPFSKTTTFGIDDVYEMIGMIHNGETTRVYVGEKRNSAVAVKCRVRPSKVRAMLAMRACRSSIMVGTVLNFQQMRTIVSRLAALDGPWNCPHGRPTLRHACTIPASA